MQKLLLASTALVASTSFAMADVNISGFAEMGIFGGENADGSEIDTQFHSDIDVFFDMAGETDSGITFGAAIDLDSVGSGAFDPARGGDDTSIFVSGALGTLTMGDTDGAYDFALSEALIGGSLQDDNEHIGYNGNSGLDGLYAYGDGDEGQVARYDYAFGDFSIALSAEIDDDSDDDSLVEIDNVEFDLDQISAALGEEARDISNDTVLGIGFRYAGEFGSTSFGVGVGYQQAGDFTAVSVETDDEGNVTDIEYDDDTARAYGLSLDASMDNGIQAIINYSEFDNFPGDRDKHYGIALGYEFGALLVAANYGQNEFDDRDSDKGYALVANYDLGGGAELQGSYAVNEQGDGEDYDRFSFGIAMSF